VQPASSEVRNFADQTFWGQ